VADVDWRLWTVERGLRLTGTKRRLGSAQANRAEVERRLLRPQSYGPPRRVLSQSRVAVRSVDGVPVYSLAAGPADRTCRRILYLHGGGYTGQISPLHWKFIRSVAQGSSAEVSVPIYPLAPLGTAASTVALVGGLLCELMVANPSEEMVVMGDSAGGGMALAVAQACRDAGGPQPAGVILISPWLDVTFSDPRQADAEARDVMLSRPGLAESARLYAGDLPATDPRVSPLFGEMSGLAPIDVFIGTADLLHPDALRLAGRCRAAGVACGLHEAAGMPHVYPLLPLLREGAQAREAIAALVSRAGN
jgi:epsilon-lactone hydrolase